MSAEESHAEAMQKLCRCLRTLVWFCCRNQTGQLPTATTTQTSKVGSRLMSLREMNDAGLRLDVGLKLWEGVPRSRREPWKAMLEQAGLQSSALAEDLPQRFYRALRYSPEEIQTIMRGVFASEHFFGRPRLRTFLSSTFSDTATERNLLITDVYPYLKKYGDCLGVDCVQPADLRWGITENATEEHETSMICLYEVERCKQESAGLTFVLIAGDKVGFARVPATIPSDEYREFLGTLQSTDAALLNTWYAEDTNAVPPAFMMKTRRPELVGKEEWYGSIYPRIRSILRSAADTVYVDNPERRKYYYLSFTEEEVQEGLINLPEQERPDKVLILNRTFENIQERKLNRRQSSRIRAKYFDVTDQGTFDSESRRQLLEDVQKQLIAMVPNTNVKNYGVSFRNISKSAVKTDDDELVFGSKEYLKQFSDDFCQAYVDSISKIARSQKLADNDQVQLHLNEVNHHASTAVARARGYLFTRSSKEIYDIAMSRLSRDDPENAWTAVSGEPGTGKSSLIAKLMVDVRGKHPDSVILCRFLGTSIYSSNGRLLVSSLCVQLAIACNLRSVEDILTVVNSQEEIYPMFFDLLAESESSGKKVFLFLDALDQLDDSVSFEWLPRVIPKNVRIVLSSLTDSEQRNVFVFNAIQGLFSSEATLQLQNLDVDDVNHLLDNWLGHPSVRRTITAAQRAVLLRAVQRSNENMRPLYLNLAFNLARKWKSFTIVDDTHLGQSLREMIALLLRRLYRFRGRRFVFKALSVVSIARDGVSSGELEDILSLDDTILDEIFVHWTPPVNRVPPLLWTQILDDLPGLVVERGRQNGTRVHAWFHREFKDILTDLLGSEKDLSLKDVHHSIANYFDDASQSPKGKRRLVADQPLRAADGRPNSVKLRMLPYHLQKAEEYTRLQEVLTDLLFIEASSEVEQSMLEILLHWRQLGGYDVAIQCYEKALDAAGENVTGEQFCSLGDLFRHMGKYEMASNMHRKAMELAKKHYETKTEPSVLDSIRLFGFYQKLADTLNLNSNYEEAERTYKTTLEILKPLEAYSAQITSEEIRLKKEYGHMCVHLGRYDDAQELFQDALKKAEKNFGEFSLVVAEVCEKYGSLVRMRRRYGNPHDKDQEARFNEELCLRALKIKNDRLGKGHIASSDTILGLARHYLSVRQFELADKYFENAASILLKHLGDNHPSYGKVLYSQGMGARERGRPEEAIRLIEKALSVWSQTLEDDHPFHATGLQELALAYEQVDRIKDAEEALLRCLSIREKKFGDQHPRFLAARKQYEDLTLRSRAS